MYHDFVGIAFPIAHAAFASDTRLLKKVGQIEALTEIRHDYRGLRKGLELHHRITLKAFE
ncbi:hypothetical protein [Paraburkholderia diazotrophica]|uniref:Uncharacterized protein n=1 Tax=Paraburkholderia diazotrophica TaxID=667676 RepID=A0A1H6U1G1_9BURK|nr:hypothetical protein [Paraburkholderia diazotrophica]SEI86111.1 hypothetical protein SAMN05192539_1004335 [Paraburkholderia diazotrophica]